MHIALLKIMAALVLSSAKIAVAQSDVTGSFLLFRGAAAYKRIESGSGTTLDGQSAAHLMGFSWGVATTLDRLDARTCLPEGINTGQTTKVLIQYLDANPEVLHLSGEVLAIAAFRKAFPCP